MDIINVIFAGAERMFLIMCFVCLLVLTAMIVDLVCGLYKAKQRGEYTHSEALKRSANKFITYEGAVIIAGCVDVLLHLCKAYTVVGVNTLVGIPLVCCLIGVFLCTVEIVSMREKAESKTKKQMNEAVKLLASMFTKDDIMELIKNKASNNENN